MKERRRQMSPMNACGETPTHDPNESAQRLREKMRELRGTANRHRAEAEAERVLAVERGSA